MNDKRKSLFEELERRQKEENEKQKNFFIAIPDVFFKFYDINYYGEFSGCVIKKEVSDLTEIYQHLHNVRAESKLNYVLSSYWVPYSGCVCVEYVFEKKYCVRYSMYTENENAVIVQLSNGKCKVVPTESLSVVCDLIDKERKDIK